MKLDDRSQTPLYQQVIDDIKAAIANGTYRTGDRIPSEPELSDIYSVSRVTIRRAIEELAKEGFLTRRQGKGTFVNQSKVERKIHQREDVQSFTELCASIGMTAGAQLLERGIVTPTDDERRVFGDDCEQLVLVSRLRTADGYPIMEEHNYFPGTEFEFLLEEDLTDISIFGLVQQRTGRVVESNAGSTLEAIRSSAEMAERLQVGTGDPLFYERVFFRDQYGVPLCLSNKYIVGSRYLYAI